MWRPVHVFTRSTFEIAALTSVLLATLAYALHRFAGVGETPIVLGAIVVASIVGWNQPALRAAPRRAGRLAVVRVTK